MNYKIEIDSSTFNKNVRIKFSDKDSLIPEKHYKFIDRNNVYKLIDDGLEINLNKCYIQSFSLSEYRKQRGLGEKDYIEINNFYAEDAFFDNGVDLSYAHFIGDFLLFNETQFGEANINFYKSKIKKCLVSFDNAVFRDGNINFSDTEFGNVNVDFSCAKFGKGFIDFTSAQFGHGFIDFSSTIFRNCIINFTDTNFGNGRLSFYNADFFNCNLFFPSSIFGNGLIDFSKAIFRMGKILFCESRFGYGDLDFSKSKFLDCILNFDKIRYNSKNIIFYNSTVNNLSFNDCQFNNYLDLRVSECEKLDLTNSIARDIIDFRPDKVSKVCITKLTIIGIQNLGIINLGWKTNNVKQLIENQGNETTHREKAEQFRTLKENFHKIGQYDDEDKAYVEFKKHELREEKSNFKKKGYNIKIRYLLHKLLRRIFFFQQKNKYEKNYKRINKLFSLIYKKYLKYGNIKYSLKKIIFEDMGVYGTSPKRVAISMLFTWFFFAIVYTIFSQYIVFSIKIGNPSKINELPCFLKAAYFSIITFLTIGYGDYVPNGIINLLSGIEGFLGLFLMAYFVVAFSRKVLR